MELKRQIGLITAVMIIIADVIGTGIFTTSGQVLGMTGNAVSVLVLFAVGGVIALTGSLCYAELATMWPEDGGEYVYLKKIYGPLPSFLTGWISLLIGFSLAAAMSSIMAVNYFNKLAPGGVIQDEWLSKLAAAGIIFLFSIIHVLGVQKGSLVQNILTVMKFLVVFFFIVMGFYFADWNETGRLVQSYPVEGGSSILTYGAALITIMYAYSGWNGTVYIAGEIKHPEKKLPRALFLGTILIIILYLGINVVYIISTPGTEIIADASCAIGAMAAMNLFGPSISPYVDFSIVVILLSSVSVQMMIGPRVAYAMAKDGAIFHSLDRVNSRFQTPVLAIVVQMAIAVVYVFIGFNYILNMLIYMGFALSIFPLMSVIGMVYLRYTRPDIKRPFKVPFFPLVPLIYIILTILILVATFILTTFYYEAYNKFASLTAVGVIAIGIMVYFIWRKALAYFASKKE
ncbi:MAG: amino acid permease [Chrysiogenales bacterium]|nr:MAG: amino acid permease [Chrysiogenales bacterium]